MDYDNWEGIQKPSDDSWPFKDEEDFFVSGESKYNGLSKGMVNFWYTASGSMDYRTKYTSAIGDSLTIGFNSINEEVRVTPANIGGKLIFTIELFKFIYGTFSVDYQPVNWDALIFSLYYPAQLDYFYDTDTYAEASRTFGIGLSSFNILNNVKYSFTGNVRSCGLYGLKSIEEEEPVLGCEYLKD
jgi:hypothetical protein